jgi:hypothetical protein
MGAVVATQVHVKPPDPRLPAQFTTGYHHALYVGACITFGAALIAATLVRHVRHPTPAPEPAGA